MHNIAPVVPSKTLDTTLLTTKEAAAFLRVSPSTVSTLRKRGMLTFVKIGRRILYSVDALNEFVAKNEFIDS
jgi:excisionase family DNA binding protein